MPEIILLESEQFPALYVAEYFRSGSERDVDEQAWSMRHSNDVQTACNALGTNETRAAISGEVLVLTLEEGALEAKGIALDDQAKNQLETIRTQVNKIDADRMRLIEYFAAAIETGQRFVALTEVEVAFVENSLKLSLEGKSINDTDRISMERLYHAFQHQKTSQTTES